MDLMTFYSENWVVHFSVVIPTPLNSSGVCDRVHSFIHSFNDSLVTLFICILCIPVLGFMYISEWIFLLLLCVGFLGHSLIFSKCSSDLD